MTEVINNKGIKNITKIFFKRSIKFLLHKKIYKKNMTVKKIVTATTVLD
jgi:hypothetical protein